MFPSRLHLIPRFGNGGAEKTLLNLIRNIELPGMVCCSGGDGVHELDQNGIQWFQVPFFPSTPVNFVRSALSLWRIVLQHKIQLIHSHHRFTSLVGRMVAHSLRLPFVCTVHDFADGQKMLSRIAIGGNIIVHSQAVKLHLIERFGAKPGWIHVVPMGQLPVFNPTQAQCVNLRQKSGCPIDSPLAIFVGRLTNEKGPDLFLQAIPLVLSRFPNARFWVVGDGELRLELESMAGRLGISSAVKFWGWQDDSSPWIGCSDLVVIPSRREGFGKVALESLMLGKPVVAAQVGGLVELIQHDLNGFLVPAEQPAAIAEKIIRLFGNHEETVRMSGRSRESVEGRFSQESMLEGVKAVYETAMAQQKRERL